MGNSTWETETGLPDDFEYTIKDAAFLKSAEVKNGEVLFLQLTGDTDEGDEYELRIQCGPGWESLDGGKTARHESGNAKKGFNSNAHYGLWIDRCIKELNIGEVLGAKGEATEAKVWVGFKFHLKQKQFGFKNSQTGEDVSYSRLLPEAFLGEAGSASSKPAAKSEPATNGSASNGASNGAGNKVLMAKLKAEAKKHDTHEAFVDAAMEIAGVTDDDDILNSVIAEDGIYALARA